MPDVDTAGDRTRPWVGDGPALVSVAEVTGPASLDSGRPAPGEAGSSCCTGADSGTSGCGISPD